MKAKVTGSKKALGPRIPARTLAAQNPMLPRMSLEQIEEGLVRSILSGTLALHTLRNSRKPLSTMLKELVEIEAEVGQFVGRAMQAHAEHLRETRVNGSLANALSFIPFGPASEPAILPEPRQERVLKPRAKSLPTKAKKARKRKVKRK